MPHRKAILDGLISVMIQTDESSALFMDTGSRYAAAGNGEVYGVPFVIYNNIGVVVEARVLWKMGGWGK